jgi:hypothetical protein
MNTIAVWLLLSVGSSNVTTIATLADREECTRLRNEVASSRQSELRCVQAVIVTAGGTPVKK